MKIGMLTYHNANNFGAALQAFALERYLIQNGIDCEYLDYSCEKIEQRYRGKSVHNIRDIFKFILDSYRNKSFERFRKKIKISKEKYNRENIWQSNPKYDAFIVGSDQVWNYKLNGNDRTYLLDFSTKPRLSYASSLGMDHIDLEYQKIFFEHLKRFNSILVRETMAKNILQNLGVKNCDVALDPCFLMEDSFWVKMTKAIIHDDYILYYAFSAENLQMFEKRFSNRISHFRKCKLGGGIKMKDFFSPFVSVKYTTGPLEFISLIKHAKLVVTDSFHATVFSIIFKTPFVTFYRNRPGKDARIRELLEISNLEEREFSLIQENELFNSRFCENKLESLDNKRMFSRKILLKSIDIL